MAASDSKDDSSATRELAAKQRELEQLKSRLERKVEALDHLVRISALLTSTLGLPEVLRLIMSSAKDLLKAEASSVLLVDEDTNELVFEVALGPKGEDVRHQRIAAGRGIAGHVAQTGERMVVSSVRDSPYFDRRLDQLVGFETRNMLAVPLKGRERIVGVVEIINTIGRSQFDDEDLAMASTLGNQAAIAIDNARLYKKLSEALVTSRMSYRV
jgi:sigma-B regulation protein RsbU (phosphoserine phosphatase)